MLKIVAAPIAADECPIAARKTAVLRDIKAIAEEDPFDSEPFFVVDLADVQRKYQTWSELLPRVEPFYAVKCHPDPMIVKTLAALGTGFDCASKAEIELAMSVGATPDNIIFAHPCKPTAHVKYARKHNVAKMTFDKREELDKIKVAFPEAELVLRILPDDSRSLCRLGNKFGCPLASCDDLLRYAQELELNVVGVSFHVGSGCLDASAYRDACLRARYVWDLAEQLGFNMTILDVGGGFPGSKSAISFETAAATLSDALEELFPASLTPDLRIIAEPGRYFVASACTLVCNVIAKSAVQVPADDADPAAAVPHYMAYLNDGVYGSFNCIERDHQTVYGYPLDADVDAPLADFTLWGPTCDGIDRIVEKVRLPDFDVGSWVVFHDMGAYTVAGGCAFNGFVAPHRLYRYVLDCPEETDTAVDDVVFEQMRRLAATTLWTKLSPPASPRAEPARPCTVITVTA